MTIRRGEKELTRQRQLDRLEGDSPTSRRNSARRWRTSSRSWRPVVIRRDRSYAEVPFGRSEDDVAERVRALAGYLDRLADGHS